MNKKISKEDRMKARIKLLLIERDEARADVVKKAKQIEDLVSVNCDQGAELRKEIERANRLGEEVDAKDHAVNVAECAVEELRCQMRDNDRLCDDIDAKLAVINAGVEANSSVESMLEHVIRIHRNRTILT